MNFIAEIKVMPLKELLDPQGKAVVLSLQNLGLAAVNDVRIGKHIRLEIEAGSAEEAKELATQAASQLLANPVMEEFEIEIV